MCKFFSFVGDGHGNYKYHDWKDRLRIGVNADPGPDSHAKILESVPTNIHDRWSKYEYNPLTKAFTVDAGVGGHDHEAAEAWVKVLDFKRIVPALVIKPIVHPFKDRKPPKKITEKHLELLRQWDSVRDSVRDSVWAYISSFVEVKYKHDFSSAVKLWEMGLVPSFADETWRLHGGPEGKVLWKGKLKEVDGKEAK